MRHQLRNKEVKEYNRLIEKFGVADFFSKKDKVELLEDKEVKALYRNGVAVFFFYEDKPVPTIKLLLQSNFLKRITVDMGAVKFVCNGANIMRPGIVKIDEGFSVDDIISVVDVTYGKVLAVGRALFSSNDMQAKNSGIVVQNLHWVGDEIWKI